MNITLLILNKALCFTLLFTLNQACNKKNPKMVPPAALISNSSELGKDTISTNEVYGSDKKIQLEAKIIRILDGDTAEILYGQLPIKFRLEHIDCPEKRGKQPFGNRAKIALSDLCFGQMVTISSDGKFDRNGRLIGVIFDKDSLNVNKEMVRLGMAWHFKKYSDDMSYDMLEREARAAKAGLWSDPNPIAPWDYR